MGALPDNEYFKLKDQWQLIQADGVHKEVNIRKQQINDCVILGGTPVSDSMPADLPVYPTLLWCPKLRPSADSYLLLFQQRFYDTFTDYVRDMAAARTAY